MTGRGTDGALGRNAIQVGWFQRRRRTTTLTATTTSKHGDGWLQINTHPTRTGKVGCDEDICLRFCMNSYLMYCCGLHLVRMRWA
jgi:hypothetical protein